MHCTLNHPPSPQPPAVHRDHLIAVTAGANRSKCDKEPEDWKPLDETYWCQYATDWTETKERWGLTMTRQESRAVLGACRYD